MNQLLTFRAIRCASSHSKYQLETTIFYKARHYSKSCTSLDWITKAILPFLNLQ
jgi:hypothetical protein